MNRYIADTIGIAVVAVTRCGPRRPFIGEVIPGAEYCIAATLLHEIRGPNWWRTLSNIRLDTSLGCTLKLRTVVVRPYVEVISLPVARMQLPVA